jgi:hypothetical protein
VVAVQISSTHAAAMRAQSGTSGRLPPVPPAGARAHPAVRAAVAFSKTAEAPLLFLATAFVIEISITAPLHSAAPELHPDVASVFEKGSEHAQWVILLGAGLAAAFLALATACFARLHACGWELWPVRHHLLVAELVACGSGGLLYSLSGSSNILSGCIFLPVVLFLGCHAAQLWLKADMLVFPGAARRDRLLLAEVAACSMCIIATAAVISATGHPQNAMLVGFSCFIIISALAGVTKCALARPPPPPARPARPLSALSGACPPQMC